jgi:hypothetical protein
MKIVKILVGVILVYVGIVVAFESMIGVLQPANEATLVITTSDEAGESSDRVVSRLESQGKLYVAANHWPRAWYRRAFENPNVQIDLGDGRAEYLAVPVAGGEHDTVNGDNPLGLGFRMLTGFPPRLFLRLERR